MPSKTSDFRWFAEHQEFCDQYAKATETRADAIFEEMFDIADSVVQMRNQEIGMEIVNDLMGVQPSCQSAKPRSCITGLAILLMMYRSASMVRLHTLSTTLITLVMVTRFRSSLLVTASTGVMPLA